MRRGSHSEQAGDGVHSGARKTDHDTSDASPTERAWTTAVADRRDAPYLAAVVLGGVLVVGIYLATNEFPAFGAGLYTLAADEIIAHGYGLPARIPYYSSAEGVPFAYPPLQFYVLAVLRDLTGASAFTLAFAMPAVATVAYLVPTYLLARDVLESRWQATVAGLLVALNPQILQWQLSAGGIVRAPSFFLAVSTVYAGYNVFTVDGRRWLVAGGLGFLLTVLSHPTYALFVVFSYVVMWAVLDRSAVGFGRGLAVGVTGLLLAAPWFGQVIATHGPTVFLAASGTHGGVGGGLWAFLDGISGWSLVPLAAGVILLAMGSTFLPVWLAASEVLLEQSRFSYFIGSLAIASALALLWERARHSNTDLPTPSRAHLAALVLVGYAAGGGSLAYGMTTMPDSTTPEFVDDDDVAAMEWAANQTPRGATFVVLGDAAEWFPAFTHRTILIGPWGVEWKNAAAFDRQLSLYETISTCMNASCVDRTLARAGVTPDYLYVPKGSYTVRGDRHVQFGTLERSLTASPRYEQAYENDGVVIFRVRDDVSNGSDRNSLGADTSRHDGPSSD